MTELQRSLWQRIFDAAKAAQTAEVVYETDWLGYLPFGQYHWFACTGKDVGDLPPGWQFSDVEVLETDGFLIRTGEWEDPRSDDHRKVFFRLALTPA
jgi:hypothetical protein